MAGKIAALIMAGFVFISCGGEASKESLRIATPLADKGYIDMTLTLEFADPEDHRLFIDNQDKIRYALILMFKGYNATDLVNRGLSNNSIKKLLSSRFHVALASMKIDAYDLRDAKNNKVKKKSILTQDVSKNSG